MATHQAEYPDKSFWDKVLSFAKPMEEKTSKPINDYTHLAVILDRSGSMESIRDDIIGGFNTFLDQQKAEPGSATLTLVQFDTEDSYETIHRFKALQEVPKLTRETFVPRSGTPLLDAIGQGIYDLEKSLVKIPEDEQPSRVIMIIITDGQENSSRGFRKDQIERMIKEKQEKFDWQFVFLSADLSAVRDALDIGVRPDTVMAFSKDARGTAEAWTSLSTTMSSYRAGRSECMSLVGVDDREELYKLLHTRLLLDYHGQHIEVIPSGLSFNMGRNPKNDLVVDQALVSRSHVTIEFRQSQFILKDNSTNGTYLLMENGARLFVRREESVLRDRGMICLGQALFEDNPDIIRYECRYAA
jgi:hypothetical protein